MMRIFVAFLALLCAPIATSADEREFVDTTIRVTGYTTIDIGFGIIREVPTTATISTPVGHCIVKVDLTGVPRACVITVRRKPNFAVEEVGCTIGGASPVLLPNHDMVMEMIWKAKRELCTPHLLKRET